MNPGPEAIKAMIQSMTTSKAETSAMELLNDELEFYCIAREGAANSDYSTPQSISKLFDKWETIEARAYPLRVSQKLLGCSESDEDYTVIGYDFDIVEICYKNNSSDDSVFIIETDFPYGSEEYEQFNSIWHYILFRHEEAKYGF